MSNLTVLTRSHAAIAAKKRARQDQIKEIVFDDDARREFLTGFHKRKLAKAEAARKKAQDKEKREHLELRREQRRMLRERAVQNAAEVEKAYGAIIDSDGDEEWTGINDGSEKHEQEQYENEEHLATVTIVEDFDPDTIIHGSRTIAPRTTTNANSTLQYDDRKASKPIQKLGIPHKTKSKPRTKVHYETKDARKLERTKQRARRTEKADLAGGKVKAKGAARRKKAAKGKGRH